MEAATPMMTVNLVHIVTPTDVYHLVRIALTVLMVSAGQLQLVAVGWGCARRSAMTCQILVREEKCVLVREYHIICTVTLSSKHFIFLTFYSKNRLDIKTSSMDYLLLIIQVTKLFATGCFNILTSWANPISWLLWFDCLKFFLNNIFLLQNIS